MTDINEKINAAVKRLSSEYGRFSSLFSYGICMLLFSNTNVDEIMTFLKTNQSEKNFGIRLEPKSVPGNTKKGGSIIQRLYTKYVSKGKKWNLQST